MRAWNLHCADPPKKLIPHRFVIRCTVITFAFLGPCLFFEIDKHVLKIILSGGCRALLLFYSYCQRRALGSRGLLVVYVFIFYQTLRVVPHGTKGTGPRFVTRPVYLRSQFRNNTNTVSALVPLIHLLQVLCTRYASVAHHRVLQTSGRGWADSKAVHGMECSGVRSLYWRSLSVGAAA